MGKTPKVKHGNERRRPYNYPRNAQAQTQKFGTESRNYSYPSGNVPRRPPVYSVQYQGIPVHQSNHQYYFGGGREYRGKYRGIDKPLKTAFHRRGIPNQYNQRVLSRVRKSSAQKVMQSEIHVRETVQETVEESACEKEGSAERIIKNGPESCSSFEEELKVENGSSEIGDNISDCNDGTGDNKSVVSQEDSEKIQSKSKPADIKEKKVKKNPTTKISPKGKITPKSKKETKPEVTDEGDARNKEKEKLQNEALASGKGHESAPVPDFQSNIQPSDLSCPITETRENDDSVVEISRQEQSKSHDNASSTGVEESSSKSVDTLNMRDSPRTSTKIATRSSSQKQTKPVKPDSCSIIVLDSDDSISVLNVSRKSHDRSYGETLRSISGRPSLRTLPAYNRSSTVGSASIRSNVSSRSLTTTGNGSESDSQESKILQPRSSSWGLFRSSSRNASSQDYATDYDESTNRSLADDSGNDSEATTDPPEAPLIISFGKRKCQDAGSIKEVEQETKRTRCEQERKSIASLSASGLFSVMSPMNLFARKIRGEKGKSSTPVQMPLNEGTRDNISVHEDDVSKVQVDDENTSNLIEKGSIGAALSEVEEEGSPKTWCTIA